MNYPQFIVCYNFLTPKQMKQYIDDTVNHREFIVPKGIKRIYMQMAETTILDTLTAIEDEIDGRRKSKIKRPWLIELFENTESDRYQICLEAIPIRTESVGGYGLFWERHIKYEDEKTDRFIFKQDENEGDYYLDIDNSS